MRIGIIIPDRGDRPVLYANCMRMIDSQTIHANKSIELIMRPIVYHPESGHCDITQRYKRGYDSLRNMDIDVIFLMESDDYYAPDYIESMLTQYMAAGRPPLFGVNHTTYYHIFHRKYYDMNHISRSSAMNTLIRPDMNFKWCKDSEPYTDIHLWENIRNGIIIPQPVSAITGGKLCIGIKHGIGMTGGNYHVTNIKRYEYDDTIDMDYLRKNTDIDSFNFYKQLNQNGKTNQA